jgi:thiol-disulfide isomerase/thioredoxin
MESSSSSPNATPTEEPDAFDALVGADGLIYSFASFAERRIVAVVFVANGCPSVRSLEPLLQEFHCGYEDRGVQLVLINSNNSALSPRDTYAAVVERARESGFSFPYLKDESGSVARRFGAVTTPHAFVLDERRCVRYKGRVADSRQASTATVSYLVQAVEDLLSGRDVAVAETEPYGCSIVW